MRIRVDGFAHPKAFRSLRHYLSIAGFGAKDQTIGSNGDSNAGPVGEAEEAVPRPSRRRPPAQRHSRRYVVHCLLTPELELSFMTAFRSLDEPSIDRFFEFYLYLVSLCSDRRGIGFE